MIYIPIILLFPIILISDNLLVSEFISVVIFLLRRKELRNKLKYMINMFYMNEI